MLSKSTLLLFFQNYYQPAGSSILSLVSSSCASTRELTHAFFAFMLSDSFLLRRYINIMTTQQSTTSAKNPTTIPVMIPASSAALKFAPAMGMPFSPSTGCSTGSCTTTNVSESCGGWLLSITGSQTPRSAQCVPLPAGDPPRLRQPERKSSVQPPLLRQQASHA